ncbi:MAG: helix-turn-helix domain-containing protein [Oscillospiraceae bacterium]|nr:helix-turn-helix domain-containing protein [Oscillospiraceae bacterium]
MNDKEARNAILTLDNLPELLNAEQVAKYLDIAYVNALKLVKHGGIPHIKIGNQYRVPKKRFQEWVESQIMN